MKRFLVLFALLFAVILGAAESQEQKAVRAVIDDIYAKLRKMDVRGVMNYYADEFTSINHDGTTKSKKDLLAIADVYDSSKAVLDKVRQISKLEDPVLMIQAVYSLQGMSVPPEQLESLKKASPEQKKAVLDQLRLSIKNMLDMVEKQKEPLNKMFDTMKVESVKVAGDKATVFLSYTEPNGKKVRDETSLCKRNGKWLIVKTVCTLVK